MMRHQNWFNDDTVTNENNNAKEKVDIQNELLSRRCSSKKQHKQNPMGGFFKSLLGKRVRKSKKKSKSRNPEDLSCSQTGESSFSRSLEFEDLQRSNRPKLASVPEKMYKSVSNILGSSSQRSRDHHFRGNNAGDDFANFDEAKEWLEEIEKFAKAMDSLGKPDEVARKYLLNKEKK